MSQEVIQMHLEDSVSGHQLQHFQIVVKIKSLVQRETVLLVVQELLQIL